VPETVFVERDALLKAVRRACKGAEVPTDMEADLVKRLERWAKKQAGVPDLVGTTEAAKILGMRPPHVSRLRDAGQMPEAVPVGGGNDVYLRSEVEALASERQSLAAARQAQREGKAA
jgi:predicted DNA-binding transcriptional regulator AlpA